MVSYHYYRSATPVHRGCRFRNNIITGQEYKTFKVLLDFLVSAYFVGAVSSRAILSAYPYLHAYVEYLCTSMKIALDLRRAQLILTNQVEWSTNFGLSSKWRATLASHTVAINPELISVRRFSVSRSLSPPIVAELRSVSVYD